MKLAWVTDIHLNFVSPRKAHAFCAQIVAAQPDAVLVGGDIAEADDLAAWLDFLRSQIRRPIYFVLGNHDFYRGSIAGVRAQLRQHAQHWSGLTWLDEVGVVRLTAQTALVGHSGWADGRYGDYARSWVELNDYQLIAEFRDLDREARRQKLTALGDEAAAHFRRVLPEALARCPHVVLLTHVPPFREACWHEGQISDDNFLPHFTCRAVGEALVESMAARPDRNLLVLCGHTHGAGEARILPNLQVWTGGAEYGAPALQRFIRVP